MNKIRFDELPLSPEVQRAIADMGFEEASPIQTEAIPVVLEGRDIIGQAQTVRARRPLLVYLPSKASTRTIAVCRRLSCARRVNLLFK
ncbi:DEAD/DEAH box helicase [Pontibacter sp. BAB1700]|uniref:DEAD/DEAH box helicase n=1 Tax=Pontibacter sp. BAB1700 TaxID=1144253 RepID=UPI0026CB1EEB|nr:DEAD/DEAH box helicase [Pontibacter sp. BAB1700]